MRDPFEQHLLGFAGRHGLIEPGSNLLLALSGGGDSTALALALVRLRGPLQVSLKAFHLNHGLRGGESDGDESFVRGLCRKLEIPLQVARADVRRLALEQGQNLEACARQIRYSLLVESGGGGQAPGEIVAATGHTQDDQAETLLLRLLRGAGVEGLACMRPRKRFQQPAGLTLVRPLLETSRLHVEDYLKRQGQNFRHDASNSDLRLDRVWVRRRLRPILEERINPSVAPVLARSAQLLEDVADWLGRQAEDFLNVHLSRQHDEWILPAGPCNDLHPALRGEVLRRAWRRALEEPGSDPPHDSEAAPSMQVLQAGFQQVEQMKHVAADPSGGEVHLGSGWRLLCEFGTLRLTRRTQVELFRRTLAVPGEAHISELGAVLKLRRRPDGRRTAAARVLLKLPEKAVIVRNRRPGDRYHPAGSEREEKLKDLLQRARVPKSRRDALILLLSDDVLLWVEGLPPRADRQVEGDHPQAVSVELERVPDSASADKGGEA